MGTKAMTGPGPRQKRHCLPPPQLRRTGGHVTGHESIHQHPTPQTFAIACARVQANSPPRLSGYAASAKGLNEGNFSPEEFVAEAISLGHPADHSSLFPKEVKSKLDNIQKKTIHQLALERTEEIKRWLCFVLGQGELSKRT